MDFIKYIDFFSIKFSFYTNNQPHNQSFFGGIMTFLYVMFCILILILFGYDDLEKLNPITTVSEIPDSERKLVNMNDEKIYIPFRIVNYENKFVDHREILYIVPYLIEGRFNNEIGMDLKYTLLNYKLCNETSLVNRPENYKIDVPLNQLFCLEKDNILFGGNWNHYFLNYIEINLYLCEEGIAFNSSDSRCSKLNNYLQKLNSSLLFDFYFPIVQFQPKNIERPVEIIYKNYYYRFSTYSYKIEKLYIREHVLSDDRSILKTNYKNNSYWGRSTLYSDDYYLPKDFDAISDNSNSSRIYSLNIYMDDGLVYYTRTFKKLFIILSDFFPIFRFLLFFLKRFTQHIKMTLTKRNLIELIFENTKINHSIKSNERFKIDSNRKKKKFIKFPNKSENEIIIKNKSLNIKEYNNLNYINNNITIIRNKSEKIENNTEKNRHIFNSVNYKNNINKKLKSSINDDNFIKQINSLNNSIQDYSLEPFKIIKPHKKYKSNHHTYKPKKFLFPFYYYFLDVIFDNLVNPKRFFNFSRKYFTIYNFMCQVYDISSHVVLIKQFNILKNILKETLFENNENFIPKLYNKINISNNNIIESLGNEFKHNKSLNFNYISQ